MCVIPENGRELAWEQGQSKSKTESCRVTELQGKTSSSTARRTYMTKKNFQAASNKQIYGRRQQSRSKQKRKFVDKAEDLMGRFRGMGRGKHLAEHVR